MVCYSPARGGGASRFESVLNPAPNSTAAESHIHMRQMITTAMLPGGRSPASVSRPNPAHRHDRRTGVTQARLPRVVQCPPPPRSSRHDSSAKTCSGAHGARCRPVVPLAARLDTRVLAGAAAVVRLSGTGLPVLPARGCRHDKKTGSCPSSPVPPGRSSSAGGQAARRLPAPARRPAGQQRTREAARWPLMRYGDVQPPPPVPPAGASPCPAVLPGMVRLPPAGRVISTRRAWALGEAGMVTCKTPSA